MLKNDYLVAKIGVDTAENEPLKNLTLFILLFIRVLSRFISKSGSFENRPFSNHAAAAVYVIRDLPFRAVLQWPADVLS